MFGEGKGEGVIRTKIYSFNPQPPEKMLLFGEGGYLSVCDYKKTTFANNPTPIHNPLGKSAVVYLFVL
jgi:hypothetical protein